MDDRLELLTPEGHKLWVSCYIAEKFGLKKGDQITYEQLEKILDETIRKHPIKGRP